MQGTKKKPKEIDMASIADGGGNLEAKGSEAKTLGVSLYIIHDGKPWKGRSNYLY